MTKQLKILFSLCLSFSGLCSPTDDTDVEKPPTSAGTVKSENTVNRLRLGIDIGYQVAPQGLSGPSANLGLQFATSKNWGIVGAFAHVFTTGLGDVDSSFDFGVVRAITGTLMTTKNDVAVGGNDVLTSEEYHSGGFRTELHTTIFFFTAAKSIEAFAGLGITFMYELSSATSSNTYFGLRYDMITNDYLSLSPMRLFYGVRF